MTSRQMQWILSLSSRPCWMMTQSCPICHSVVYWVCKWRPQKWPMDEPRAFSAWAITNIIKILLEGGLKMAVVGKQGWFWHCLLKDMVCIQRPPLLSFHDKLRHGAIWWHPGTIRPAIISQNPFCLTSALDKHYSREVDLQQALWLQWRRRRLKMAKVSKCRKKVGDGENQGTKRIDKKNSQTQRQLSMSRTLTSSRKSTQRPSFPAVPEGSMLPLLWLSITISSFNLSKKLWETIGVV